MPTLFLGVGVKRVGYVKPLRLEVRKRIGYVKPLRLVVPGGRQG